MDRVGKNLTLPYLTLRGNDMIKLRTFRLT
jgi:hypothetical protein